MKTHAASPLALRATTLATSWDPWAPSIGAAVDINDLILEEINGLTPVREECIAATMDRAWEGNVTSALYLLDVEAPTGQAHVALTDSEIDDLLSTLAQ